MRWSYRKRLSAARYSRRKSVPAKLRVCGGLRDGSASERYVCCRTEKTLFQHLGKPILCRFHFSDVQCRRIVFSKGFRRHGFLVGYKVGRAVSKISRGSSIDGGQSPVCMRLRGYQRPKREAALFHHTCFGRRPMVPLGDTTFDRFQGRCASSCRTPRGLLNSNLGSERIMQPRCRV